MPLVINELIATVESPQEPNQQPVIATSAEESEQKVLTVLALSNEREERLSVD